MNGEAEEPAGQGGGEPPRDKGFRSRKREDHALRLIEELRVSLDDLAKVKHILLQLGRYYDPVLGGGIIDLEHQKRIVGALERGRPDEALALIQARYDLYIKDRAHLGRREEG
jgi:hypothetical protein